MSLIGIANTLLGNVEKLKIYAVDPSTGQEKAGLEMDAQFNPENYTETFTINYETQTEQGTKDDLQFNNVQPQISALEFLFDATSASLLDKEQLKELFGKDGLNPRLIEFKTLFASIVNDIHQPYKFKAIWGPRTIIGYITKLEFKHQLFNNSGFPIRTLVNITVDEDPPNEEKNNLTESPDLTKIHTVVAGETLGLIAQAEYDDPGFYLEIARVNNLNHFRTLKPGMQLILPPIDKTA